MKNRAHASRFSKNLFIGFIFFSFFIGLSAYRYYQRYVASPNQSRAVLVKSLPPENFDDNVTDPLTAKRRGLFFLSRSDFEGLGLRLLENAEWFETAFPGYAELRQNSAFWKKYFNYKFEAGAIWSSPLNRSLPEKLISYAWPGCPEIFNRYGADVLLVGTSQVFRSLIPRDLQEVSAGRKKILMCARPGLMTGGVKFLTGLLKKSPPKAKWVIWGYSPWQATNVGENDTEVSEISKSLTIPSAWRQKFSDVLPPPAWNDLFPLTYARYRTFQSKEKKYDLSSWPTDFPTDQFLKRESDTGFWLSTSIAENSAAIRALSSKVKLDIPMAKSLQTKSCNFSESSKLVDQTLEQLLKVSERVLLFLPPFSPFLLRDTAPCYQSALIKLLNSKKSSRVFILAPDWPSLGVEEKDYVYHFAPRGLAYFDPVHTNYQGAIKVSRVVRQKLRESASLDISLSSNR
jgi:hypothetical protein